MPRVYSWRSQCVLRGHCCFRTIASTFQCSYYGHGSQCHGLMSVRAPLGVWDLAAIPVHGSPGGPCSQPWFPHSHNDRGEGRGGGDGEGGRAGQGRETAERRHGSGPHHPHSPVTCSPTGPGGPGKPLGPSSPFCPKRPCWPRGPGSPSAPCGDTKGGVRTASCCPQRRGCGV